MTCRSPSVPPGRSCSTCATRRSRRCRPSARCTSRSEALRARMQEHEDVVALLSSAIAAEPAAVVREGDVIAAGYDPELDELRRIATHTDAFLLELERRERERTGLAALKVGYNRVQGF